MPGFAPLQHSSDVIKISPMSKLSKFLFSALLVAGLSMLTYFGCRQQQPKINPVYRITPTAVEVSQDISIKAISVQVFVRNLKGDPLDTLLLNDKISTALVYILKTTPKITS